MPAALKQLAYAVASVLFVFQATFAQSIPLQGPDVRPLAGTAQLAEGENDATEQAPSGENSAERALHSADSIEKEGLTEFEDAKAKFKPSQDSARDTLRTFIAGMEFKRYRAATETLDFSEIEPSPDPFDRVGYAQMLKACIDRLAIVDFRQISDAAVGKPVPFPPDSQQPFIFLERGEDGEWRFTPDTIAQLEVRYELLKEKPIVGSQNVVPVATGDGTNTAAAAEPIDDSQNGEVPAAAERELQVADIPDHLQSARRVMRALYESLQEQDYDTSVSLLDFGGVEASEGALGPYVKMAYARDLWAVIERMQDFDFGTISDDPRGPPFHFPIDAQDQPITISRNDLGVWRFSADTIERLEALKKVFAGREAKFVAGSSRPWYRRELFMGNEVWRLLVLIGSITLGLIAGQIVRLFCYAMAERLRNNERVLRSLTYEAFGKTVPAIAVVIGLGVGISNLTLGFSVEMLTGTVLHVILTVVIGYLCFRLVDVVVGALREMTRRSGSTLHDMLVPIVSTALRLTVLVLVLIEIATAVSDQPPSAVIAGLGAGGLAIGLAAQDTIKNVFGSVMIFADRPFELGDRIVIDGYDGPVEAVGFRSTRVRTLEGHLVTIPNGQLADKTICNIGKRPYIRRVLNIRLSYQTPVEKVELALDILRELLEQHEGRHEERPPRVFLHEFLDSAMNVRVYYWYHPGDFWGYCDFGSQLNLQIAQRFRAAGIDFALPAQTLFMTDPSDSSDQSDTR